LFFGGAAMRHRALPYANDLKGVALERKDTQGRTLFLPYFFGHDNLSRKYARGIFATLLPY